MLGGQVCGAHLGSGGWGEPLTEAQLLPTSSSRLVALLSGCSGSCSPGVALGPHPFPVGGSTGNPPDGRVLPEGVCGTVLGGPPSALTASPGLSAVSRYPGHS